MPTQEQIKKVLIEEFNEEINEIFGLGRNKDAISSLDPRPLSGKTINLSVKLPRSVRKTLISGIATALSSNPDSIDAAKAALEKYKTDPDIRTFIDFLEKIKRTPPGSISEGMKEELTSLIKKSGTNDYGLVLVAQILTTAGLQTGISDDNLVTLSAIADPNSALPSTSVSPTDGAPPSDVDSDSGADGDDVMNKDLPLSITKRQKETSPGPGKPAEIPLNSYLQKKLGLSPKSTTKLVKNISSYLRAKNIPVAESLIKSLIKEALAYTKADFDSLRQQIADIEQKLTTSPPPAERKFLEKSKNNLEAQIGRMEAGLKSQKDAIKGRKEKERADYQTNKKAIEKIAKKHGVVGNIFYKYLARQGKKDPKFAAMFADTKKLDATIKQVRRILRRQLRRRGYDDTEIKKLTLETIK